MENEVNTLLARLGLDFSFDDDKKGQQPEGADAQSNGKDGATDDLIGGNGHSNREAKENTDYHRETTSDADEDILDMIANILQDHPSANTIFNNAQTEKSSDKVNSDKENNNVPSYNTYFVPLVPNSLDNKDRKSISNSTGQGVRHSTVTGNESLAKLSSFTTDDSNVDLMLNDNTKSQGLISNQDSKENLKASGTQLEFKPPNSPELENQLLNVTANANVVIPALKQSGHQTMHEDHNGKLNTKQPSRPDKDVGMTHETSWPKLKPQRQSKSSVESKSNRDGSVKRSGENGADFGVNFQTTPTPSSQLLQTFPGVVSYNVKLTNEESPPGKGRKVEPKNPTNKAVMPSKRQAMTQRIFEVGQAAIEAGKNMILAQESHVDKEKIYDIVGTRNVTSVGRYLITIGEELLNRGKALSSKEPVAFSNTLQSRAKGKADSEIEMKNLSSLASFDVQTIRHEADTASKAHNSDSDNVKCMIGAVHHTASLRGKMRAGLFIATGYAKDPTECGKRCCDNSKCDLALVVNNECYAVECFHWTLCQVVPHRRSSQFKSEIVDIKRLKHFNKSEAVMRHHLQTNSSPMSHYPNKVYAENEPQTTLSMANEKQSEHSSTQGYKSNTSTKSKKDQNRLSQPNTFKTQNVQRKEFNCRSSVMNNTGNLEPGGWRLSGRTNSSSKCVDRCCSQNGCDLAFQIGDLCYSLACYKDARGCNPLAISVGLSYIRLKRKDVLAAKSLNDTSKTLLKPDNFSKKNDIFDRPLDDQKNDETLSLNKPDKLKYSSGIHPQNMVTNISANDSELCRYTIKRDMFFRAGHNAGEFRRAKEVEDVDKCAQQCCNSSSCDVVYVVENICFLVKCRDASSCEPVSFKNSKYRSSVVLLTQRSGSHSSLVSESGGGSKNNNASEAGGVLKPNHIKSKVQSKQNDLLSEKAGETGNKKKKELRQSSLNPSNDLDILIDNDSDDDVVDDVDDDIGSDIDDYGTNGDGDDKHENRNGTGSNSHKTDKELKKYQQDTVMEHNIRPEKNNNATYRNPVRVKNTEDHVNTNEHQVHKSPTSVNLENNIVKKKNQETPYSSKHGPNSVRLHNASSLVNQSGNKNQPGAHERNNTKHSTNGYKISTNDVRVFYDQGFGNYSKGEFENSTIGDGSLQGKHQGTQSSNDEVEIDNAVKLNNAFAHPNKTSFLASEIIERERKSYNLSHKVIPAVITKQEQTENILGRLGRENKENSELFLQLPASKSNNLNDETYVIYDDADNGNVHGLSGSSIGNASPLVNNTLQKDAKNLHWASFTSQRVSDKQHNTSQNPGKEYTTKPTGIRNTSTNVDKFLDQMSKAKNLSHVSDNQDKKFERNNKLLDPKNSTLLSTNDTEKNMENAINMNNKTENAEWNEGIANRNQTSLRQRDGSGDTIPKNKKENNSNTAIHTDDENAVQPKSNLRGKNDKGDKILKPKAQDESELQYGIDQNYPFLNFPPREKIYTENTGDQWPWEIIPLRNNFQHLPLKSKVFPENAGSGLLETSDKTNKQKSEPSNTKETSPSSHDFKTKSNTSLILHGFESLNRASQKPGPELPGTLASPTSHLKNLSHLSNVNREQLHRKLKSVLKSYYAEAEKGNTSGATKVHHGNKDKLNFSWSQGSTDHPNQLHKEGSNSHYLKEKNKLASDKVNQKAISQQSENNVEDGNKDPYLILASAGDIGEDPTLSEPPFLFPKNYLKTGFTNKENFNPFTSFLRNDQSKTENAKDRKKVNKQVVRDKNEEGDSIPGAKNRKKGDDDSSQKKLKDAKPLSNNWDEPRLPSHSRWHKSNLKNDAMEKTTNATSRFFSVVNGSLNNQSLINDLENTYLAILSREARNKSRSTPIKDLNRKKDHRRIGNSAVQDDTDSLHINLTHSNNYENFRPHNHTSKQKEENSGNNGGILKDIDKLLVNKKSKKRHRPKVSYGSQNSGHISRQKDRKKVPMTILDSRNAENNHTVTPNRHNSIKKGNKNTVLNTAKESNNTASNESERFKTIALGKPFTRQHKQKTETKAITANHQNNSYFLPVLANKTKPSSNSGSAEEKPIHNIKSETLRNKSANEVDTNKVHSNVIPADTNKNSLGSNNSENVISKYSEDKSFGGVSRKHLREPGTPKVLDKTEGNQSKESNELTEVEIFDGDDDEGRTGNSHTRNKHKLPLNNDVKVGKIKYSPNLHSIKGNKFNVNKPQKVFNNKTTPRENTEYSKLGKILFDDTKKMKSLKLESRMPENQNNSSEKKSKNKTSEIDNSSETRNSYNVRPWAWDDTEKRQRKNTTSMKQIQENNIGSPGNTNENKQMWGKDKDGDIIPGTYDSVKKALKNEKSRNQALVKGENRDEVEDDIRKSSESEIRHWGRGIQYNDSQNNMSKVNPDTEKNTVTKLWERNEDGDSIPKPNREWLSEDEIEDTLLKPEPHFRFGSKNSFNDMDEKNEHYGVHRDLEKIRDENKNIPLIRDSWLSGNDVVDSDLNPDPDIEERINRNENSVTHFVGDNKKFERNEIPTSKVEEKKILKENDNNSGMFGLCISI